MCGGEETDIVTSGDVTRMLIMTVRVQIVG